MADSFYFYVLQCKDGTYYAGYTTNLERRLAEHNNGKGAKYTRLAKRRPTEMIYSEVYPTKSDAMKAEYAFKQLTRKEKETYITSNRSLNILYTNKKEEL